MALVHINVTLPVPVPGTPQLILKMPIGVETTAVQIQNLDSATIYIGDKTISNTGATRGHAITTGVSFQLWLKAGDEVYALTNGAATAAGAVVITYSGI
jgi:hypothetical protein